MARSGNRGRPSIARPTDGFERVRTLGLALPEVAEGTAYGSPALKVRGKMFACIAIHKSAEPHTLAVRLDFDQRDTLIEDDPATYYLTDHYLDYPVVLVRLNRVGEDALRDLLQTGWRFMGGRRTPMAGSPRIHRSTRRAGRH